MGMELYTGKFQILKMSSDVTNNHEKSPKALLNVWTHCYLRLDFMYCIEHFGGFSQHLKISKIIIEHW